MKSQLSRLLLGNASFGDKMSALRQPEKSPDLGSVVPPGRGIYEPSTGVGQIIQSWYANVREYEERLNADMVAVPESEKIDISKYLVRPGDNEEEEIEIPDAFDSFDSLDGGFRGFGEDDDEAEPVVGEEIAFSLDDLDDFEVVEEGVQMDTTASDPFDAPFVPEPADEEADWEDDTEESDPEPEDLPVVVEEIGAADPVADEVRPVSHRAALILDIDGVMAPFAPNGSTVDLDVPGLGNIHVDVRAVERFAELDVDVVYATDWEDDSATRVFTRGLRRDTIPSIGKAPRSDRWWKVDAIEKWIAEHPETRSIIWVDDRMNRYDREDEVSHRERVEEIARDAGVSLLAVSPDSNVGMTEYEWELIDRFLAGGMVTPDSTESEESSVPEDGFGDFEDDFTFEPEAETTDNEIDSDPEWEDESDEDFEFSDVEEAISSPASEPADDDDPFGDVPPPRVVSGRVGNTGRVEGDTAP